MIRTQVQFTEEQWQALKRMAASRHVSVAEIVRQSVEMMLRSPDNRSIDEYRRLAVEIVGKYGSGLSDISTNHDRYLSESFRS
jgi:isocitrate dehydrogenase kinase/phosphatase